MNNANYQALLAAQNYNTTQQDHFHEWAFVPNGTVIDWRTQGWRVLRYCAMCDEFQNVTVPFDV